MKKALLILILSFSLIFQLGSNSVFAQAEEEDTGPLGTILPAGSPDVQDPFFCTFYMDAIDQLADPVSEYKKANNKEKNDILACGIKTGRIHFWMIPYYIVYIIEFLVSISGIIAILFLVVGGYQYVVSGAAESQKEKAKATIRNALLGLVLVLVAWVIVNAIQFALTF